MTKFYVMIASGGKYDDAWERNLFLVDSEEAAVVALDELEAQHAKLVAMYDVVKQTNRAFIMNHPPVLTPVPPMPGRYFGKSANKAEMEEWRRVAQPISEANEHKRLQVLRDACEAARQKAIELGANEDDLRVLGFDGGVFMRSFDKEKTFSYEELELR